MKIKKVVKHIIQLDEFELGCLMDIAARAEHVKGIIYHPDNLKVYKTFADETAKILGIPVPDPENYDTPKNIIRERM